MRFLSLCVLFLLTTRSVAQDINEALEKATKEAVKKAAPSIVQIVTQGGADMVVTTPKGPAFRKALGPTTGVIISEDGFIVTSLFNFLNNPTNILVMVPGRDEPLVAKRIANDRSRLLTLLKVEAKGLPAPALVAKKDIAEGQMAIALGRTLDTKKSGAPSVSVGIISAKGRIWGKAIQTDAKVSPVNYGGPLVDIQGRVQGILIPASPQGEEVTKGFEWYDSGIGFAIPFEDVMAVLPRLKEGKDLNKGILGIRLKAGVGKGPDLYGTQPEIAQVNTDSPAAKAGLQSGDQIVEIEGQPVVRLAQLQHILGTRYEGDKIALKYKRGEKVVEIKDLQLVSTLQVVAHAFLGILPLRDDPKLGVVVRHVFEKSPAERSGIKPGDRIVKYGLATSKALQPFTGIKYGRDELTDWLNAQMLTTEVAFEVAAKDGKTRTVKATLDSLPGSLPGVEWSVPEKLNGPSSAAKAREPRETGKGKGKTAEDAKEPAKIEKGLLERATADGEHKYWLYVPKTYDGNTAHGLLVWLHLPKKTKERDFEEFSDLWFEYCEKHHLILVMPRSENNDGWIASEAEGVVQAIQDSIKQYTIDRQRVVTHGMAVGGQMALHLGNNYRDLIRGVATVGAVPQVFKDNVPQQRLAFWLAGGELDPLVKSISEARGKLAEKRFSAVFKEMPNRGREYLTDANVAELARWIDVLDKQ